MHINLTKADEADIALILEGSYPFVSGGVSTWVHQIINAYPNYKFAIIFLGSTPEDYDQPCYQLPANVVHFEIHYIFSRKNSRVALKNRRLLRDKPLFSDLLAGGKKLFNDNYQDLDFFLGLAADTSLFEVYKRSKAWSHLINDYLQYSTEPSFIDYYWNIFSLQRPILTIANAVQNFIKVKVAHTISTGYAGFMGALLHQAHNVPLILTEHGIYTRERRIELWQRNLPSFNESLNSFATEVNYLQDLWLRFFSLLSQMCYDNANPIISLYSGAREQQIEEGADVTRTKIISNGVDIKQLAKLRKDHGKTAPQTIAFVGRIVPIKDVKNLIRAVYLIVKELPKIKVLIVGSCDENPQYANECSKLISVLELNETIIFKGWMPLDKLFPKISLTVLSSISEGMPLIVLESFAAGLPVVATDVGSCRNLIEGASEADKKLGTAGKVVPISNAQALSEAIIGLLTNPQQWHDSRNVAMKRAETYYNHKTVFRRYYEVYEESFARSQWQE